MKDSLNPRERTPDGGYSGRSSTDNAVAEAWFASLKRELPYGTRWARNERARPDVFGWIALSRYAGDPAR